MLALFLELHYADATLFYSCSYTFLHCSFIVPTLHPLLHRLVAPQGYPTLWALPLTWTPQASRGPPGQEEAPKGCGTIPDHSQFLATIPCVLGAVPHGDCTVPGHGTWYHGTKP